MLFGIDLIPFKGDRDKERGREREKEKKRERACVCERERMKERERERETIVPFFRETRSNSYIHTIDYRDI